MRFEITKRVGRERLLSVLLFVSIAHPFQAPVPEFTVSENSCHAFGGMMAYPEKHSPIQRFDRVQDEADRGKTRPASDTPMILVAGNSISPKRGMHGLAGLGQSPPPKLQLSRVHLGRAPPSEYPGTVVNS